LERDHEEEWKDWLDRSNRIKKRIETIPGVKGETYIEPGPANAFPRLHVTWDQEKVKITPKDMITALRNGTPGIIATIAEKTDDKVLSVGVVLLKPEQVEIVARRLIEVFQKAI
jgi:L-seryl-tRNA(Ser) seleniumtransferase